VDYGVWCVLPAALFGTLERVGVT